MQMDNERWALALGLFIFLSMILFVIAIGGY